MMKSKANRAKHAPAAEDLDVLVVGAGFGGLSAALRAAERGARVRLCERLSYPGGCAGTFRREGARFDAGATLSSGFGAGQLFARWVERHEISLTLDWIDPLVELRAPGLELAVPRDREAFVRELAERAGDSRDAVRRFFDFQRYCADALWSRLDDPSLLPPFDWRALARHAAAAPRLAPFARWIGRPLVRVLRQFRLDDFEPLRLWADAVCQITVQCGVDEAEAPLALATLDYFWRGSAHVRGGLGALADGLVGAFERAGGEWSPSDEVRAIRPLAGGGFEAVTRRGRVRARHVVANLLPSALARRLEGAALPARLHRLQSRVDSGWGACMLYRLVRPPRAASPAAVHLQLIDDPREPLHEGNHLFCSVSAADEVGRAPTGLRAMTISTHVRADSLRGLTDEERAARIDRIQARMRATMRARAPEWDVAVQRELPASPRTFERFTGRPDGLVGGIPRRAGLANWWPPRTHDLLPGLHLVGDSAFPGQSTLATALGAHRLIDRLRLS